MLHMPLEHLNMLPSKQHRFLTLRASNLFSNTKKRKPNPPIISPLSLSLV